MIDLPQRAILLLITTVKLLAACVIGMLLLVGGYAMWLLWCAEERVKGWPEE